jgi:hypothetical protein
MIQSFSQEIENSQELYWNAGQIIFKQRIKTELGGTMIFNKVLDVWEKPTWISTYAGTHHHS